MKGNNARPSEGQVEFPLESDLEKFAYSFAQVLRAPLVIWLEGDLGTGKTAFARALIHALGYEGKVKSPTYTLLEEYRPGSLQVLHMDLYRISDPGEIEFLGLADMLDEQTILLIEWPDKGATGFRNRTSCFALHTPPRDVTCTGLPVRPLPKKLIFRPKQLH